MRKGNGAIVARAAALTMAALLMMPLLIAEEGRGELGLIGGFAVPDDHLAGEDVSLSDADLLLGLRGGYQWSENWNWFADLGFVPFDSRLASGGDADTWMLRTGVERFLSPADRDWRWFLGGGLGLMDIDLGSADVERGFASLGLGQRYEGDSSRMFRWELRADRTLDDDGLGGNDLTNVSLTAGISWGVGGTPADSDGDGVIDRRDRCPGTPAGARVDDTGCPMDSDGDGVLDGLDRCPETPEGYPVDGNGCSLDSDADGVADGADRCPDTPQGATVDASGCPSDADGDGVFDGLDRCPKTPEGARVDASGCPLDSDNDGVYDGLDRCPKTPAGDEVDAKGCSLPKPVVDERKTLVLEGVEFETNSAKLTADSLVILDRVAASLRAWPDVAIEVGGHTDSRGRDAYNLTLSSSRAQAVLDYLVSKGVDRGRLTARGYGEKQPIADNATTEGQDRNRRVELRRN